VQRAAYRCVRRERDDGEERQLHVAQVEGPRDVLAVDLETNVLVRTFLNGYFDPEGVASGYRRRSQELSTILEYAPSTSLSFRRVPDA
jgi:hypothetical protein